MTMTDASADQDCALAALAACRTEVEPALRSAVDTLPAGMRHIAGYHLGWWDESGARANTRGGKALRPALALLCAQATGGRRSAAIPAAVAVELVHNFSLLHDDVMDGDHTRRHRRTAWSVFGEAAGILAGDALLTLAFQVLSVSDEPAAAPSVATLADTVQTLIDGQDADLDFERRVDVEPVECLAMAKRKTAALIGCACALGAGFGGGTPRQVAHMRAFGNHLGLLFQLVDDILGIWGDPAVTGKPVHADLRRRKKSLPVVAALASGTPAGARLAARYRDRSPLTDSDLTQLADLVLAAGGRDWCQRLVDDLLQQATQRLEAAEPIGSAALELAALARLAAGRDN